jgi:thiamine biosynthesis lipoprotein
MTTSRGGQSAVPIDNNNPDADALTWVLVERRGRPMATDVSVQMAAPYALHAEAEAAADACMAWFDEVNQRLSRFRPESELSRMYAAAGEWFAASETLYESVALAVATARASDGLFDPTMLRRLRDLGYDRDFDAIARREVSAEMRPIVQPSAARAAWRDIALDPERRRVRLPADAQVDLGGIAKGWSADVALARYCAAFPGALINVGGDLRAQGGPQPGRLWSVDIRDPRRELAGAQEGGAHLATVSLSRGALATSGAVRRWWLHDGQRQHHLLDPRTGCPVPLWVDGGDEPATLLATATAFAPTAAQAEVVAKLALLRGYPLALSAVESAWERYGALGPEADPDVGVALALIFGSGEVVWSRNLTDYLASWGTDGAPLTMVAPSAIPNLTLDDFRRLEHRS